VGIVLVLVAGALVGARRYIDSQWYVGDAGGRVAIYNGIPASVLGYQLSTVERVTELPTARATALQPWKGLEEGITAASREEAEAIVNQIRQDLEESSPRVAG
jgi:protein phosphatase